MAVNLRNSIISSLNIGLRQSVTGGLRGLLAALDLQFATTKTLTDQVSGNNLTTFSRASAGTSVDSNGLIQTASNNTPRFDHDPVTGESLGLLVEDASTNLVTYSEELNNTGWSQSAGSVSSNVDTSPSGDQTADKWVPNASTTYHFLKASATSGSTQALTYSVYAKQSGYRYLLLNTAAGSSSSNAGPVIDLQDGVVDSNFYTTIPTTYPTSVTDAGNGWWRIATTFTGNGAAVQVDHNPFPTSAVAAYAGDNTSGVLLWGAQLEEGSEATSYILTTNATATRAADIAVIDGTNFSSFYNQSAGTLLADYQAYSASGTQQIAGFTQGTSSNAVRWGLWNNQLSMDNSGTQYFASLSASTSRTKVAFSATTNDAIGALNGSLTASDSTVVMPSVDNFHIGSTATGLERFNGHIRSLTYYNTRLDDATLETLTDPSAAELWTPSDLTDLALWLDASDASTLCTVNCSTTPGNNSSISQWDDKSGNGNDVTQSAVSAQPTYLANGLNGLPALSFDGADDTMATTTAAMPTGNSARSMFVVYQPQATTSSHSIAGQSLSGINSTWFMLQFRDSAGSGDPYFAGFANDLSTGVNPTTTAKIGAVTHDDITSTTTLFKTGSQVAQGSKTLNTNSGIFRVGSSAGFSEFANMLFSEAVVINSYLPIAYRQRVEGYLAHKWGLAGDLPSHHPYKSSAPTV